MIEVSIDVYLAGSLDHIWSDRESFRAVHEPESDVDQEPSSNSLTATYHSLPASSERLYAHMTMNILSFAKTA